MKIKSKASIGIIAAAAVIIAALAAGSTVAYFTDKKTATNNFTVGDISILLQEPEWNEENGKNLTPKKTVPKDPEIVNNGVNDAFVFMEAYVPYQNVRVAADDGTLKSAEDTELFTYKVNDGWKKVSSTKDASLECVKYLYAYTGSGTELKKLAKGETTPSLFDNVTFVNVAEGELESDTPLYFDIKAYGIQSDNVSKSNSPEDVWSVISQSYITQK